MAFARIGKIEGGHAAANRCRRPLRAPPSVRPVIPATGGRPLSALAPAYIAGPWEENPTVVPRKEPLPP